MASSGISSRGFMPVIFTYPPSGIAATPYTVSPRRTFHTIGPKNSEKRSTRIPTAFAATKCPASWNRMRTAKPRNARTYDMRAQCGRRT